MTPRWRTRLRRWAFGIGALFLLLIPIPYLIRWVLERRARERTYAHWSLVPVRSVAIVPGARVYSDGRPSHMLEDRLIAALELYQHNRVSRILVSGDGLASEFNEAAAMFQWLVAHGVPPDHIATDPRGFRTLDTMQRASRVYLIRDAVICTQRFHLSRSLYLASHAGIDAVGLVADKRRYLSEWVSTQRELFAITRAVIDVALFKPSASEFESPVPILVDVTPTHDARSGFLP